MENYLELLKASFDRNLTAQESEALNNATLKYPGLRVEVRNLQKMRDLFSGQNYRFSQGFVEKVIGRIKNRLDNSIDYAFFRIAVPGLAAAFALLLISLFSGNPVSLDTLIGIDLLKPEYLTDFIFYNK